MPHKRTRPFCDVIIGDFLHWQYNCRNGHYLRYPISIEAFTACLYKKSVKFAGRGGARGSRGASVACAHARRLALSALFSHRNLHVLAVPGGHNNALIAFYLPAASTICGPWTPDNTRGTTHAATAAFYNLFIPLSLRRTDVSEGKINFTLYLNVKSFGFDRISFQIVLINLLLR